MNSIQIPNVINQMMSFFYCVGFWHRGDKAGVRELSVKWFYCIYYLLFPLSLMVGAIKSVNVEDFIFSIEMSIIAAVLFVKLCFLIWKQTELLEKLNRICVFSIRSDDDVTIVKEKIFDFMKLSVALLSVAIIGDVGETAITPFFGNEKNLFFKIAFPFDYKNSEFAYWIAATFIFTEVSLAVTTVVFSITIWYLMFCCSLRHDVLGNDLRRMGVISKESTKNISNNVKQKLFLQELKASIDAHLHIRKLVHELESLYSNLFFIQIVTSGLCICGSIYCLAFNVGDNLLSHMINVFAFLYNIAEIFMITYLGNEIKLSSNRLSYCLFESDWINQPQSTKKCVIILGEHLKQPHQLLVGKLYPLTLETFTRILNSAYSMFNVLKNV